MYMSLLHFHMRMNEEEERSMHEDRSHFKSKQRMISREKTAHDTFQMKSLSHTFSNDNTLIKENEKCKNSKVNIEY